MEHKTKSKQRPPHRNNRRQRECEGGERYGVGRLLRAAVRLRLDDGQTNQRGHDNGCRAGQHRPAAEAVTVTSNEDEAACGKSAESWVWQVNGNGNKKHGTINSLPVRYSQEMQRTPWDDEILRQAGQRPNKGWVKDARIATSKNPARLSAV